MRPLYDDPTRRDLRYPASQMYYSSQGYANGQQHRLRRHNDNDNGGISNDNGNSNGSGGLYSTGKIRHRPRQTDTWNNGGHLRINVNDNYVKYGNKRSTSQIKRTRRLVLGGVVGIASIFGWLAWKHYFHNGSSSFTTQYTPVTYHNWKPHIATGDEHSIPLQDKPFIALKIHQFISSRDYNTKWAVRRVGKIYPQSIYLEQWNAPIAIRSFPFARQISPMKNLDSDYGSLTFQTIRNQEDFARVILKDEEDHIIAPGAFDPGTIDPEAGSQEGENPRHYPEYSSDGKKIWIEGATYEDLKHYYDDDSINVLPYANEDKKKGPRACISPEFSTLYFPTCNNFHEHGILRAFDDPEITAHPRPGHEIYTKYLASGYYRDAWLTEDSPWIWPNRYAREKQQQLSSEIYDVLDNEKTDEMILKGYRSAVLKTLRLVHNYDDESFHEMRLEAIIMERMTKSPRIMDIYGHCGFSALAEVVPIEFEEAVVFDEGYETNDVVEKRNEDGIHPFNNFTATEKLGYALEMAESIADLHGFEDGIIVHDDIQVCQWLRQPDGRLKLGDFNRATIMQWDLVKGEYCKFNNGPAMANYRAPEEFAARNLNEQIDVFSFGNNIYAMLTGLWNFVSLRDDFVSMPIYRSLSLVAHRLILLMYSCHQYDQEDDDVIQKKLIDGDLPYVDQRYRERSFAEQKLVELMEKCWIYDPGERINIFDAVDFLRKAVKQSAEHTSIDTT